MINLAVIDDWLNSKKESLTKKGFVFQRPREEHGSSVSLDFDTEKAVGTIVYWPPNNFEIQVNSISDGEVVVLKEFEGNTIEMLDSEFDSLITCTSSDLI